jgi:hypothetical protein
MTTKKEKDLELLDGLTHDLAVDEAEHGELSPEDRDAVGEIKQSARSAILEARRRLLDQAREERLAAGRAPLPARILAMTKEAILDRLRQLDAMFPGQVAVQHRSFEDTPVDDLRTLLADIEAQLAPDDNDG